ncbi:MAG TPA: ornithine carbamoyltransferase [Alphaproteobacteria bacterium]|jgi:ornithine carbamoyltransferase
MAVAKAIIGGKDSSSSSRAAAKAKPRHFLDLKDFDGATLRRILDWGKAYKAGGSPAGAQFGSAGPLAGKTIALIFEKPSTRTRVSFEVAMRQMGGDVVILGQADSQLGRGETIADTARVLSRYVDAIMLRTVSEKHLAEMAAHASVPVINGLTDHGHPCQLMADLMTFEEHKGSIAGRTVAWLGDGNNVAESWIHAAARFGFSLRLATPASCKPPEATLAWARKEKADVTLSDDPLAAARGADCVVTDTWLSMSSGNAPDLDRDARLAALAPYRVDEKVMAAAAPAAIFMHCLPANREREVAAAVIDGPQSAVWDEAENRVHAQKGVLHWCLAQA